MFFFFLLNKFILKHLISFGIIVLKGAEVDGLTVRWNTIWFLVILQQETSIVVFYTSSSLFNCNLKMSSKGTIVPGECPCLKMLL